MPLKDKSRDKDSINYKARLEKKLYLAQQSPEPVFDISVCNLTEIPNNVFALCRVLRKEALYLQNNNLSSLTTGGTLSDLKNLKMLNISANKFGKLPSNIGELISLEVLDLSNNHITELPESIGDLKNLVHLDVSYNNVQSLPNGIGYCTNMQILNLTFNEELKKLPVSLGKLHSLKQLHINSVITYPPQSVCKKGVQEILKFLSTELKEDVQEPTTSKVKKNVYYSADVEEQIQQHEKHRLEKQNERLRWEKEIKNQNEREVELQQKLLTDKRKLLKSLKGQEEYLNSELMKLQQKRTLDCALLKELCQEEEKKSLDIVHRILETKRNLQLEYTSEWENERKKEENMLLSLSNESRALERKNILASMEELMQEEIAEAQKRNAEKKLYAVNSLATEVSKQNKALEQLIAKRDEGRVQLLDSLRRDEELQKSAVASLLEKSDSKSWELARRIRILEVQLAELTKLEMAKRKLESDCQITELSRNRIALTELLMNLLDQQTKRRNELTATIRKMELMKASLKDSEIFWMEQYNKLLNSKGHEMVRFLDAVNPKLVYELYINGVFHYLPLLGEVVLSESEMENLNESYLTAKGINNTKDQNKILNAIKSFLKTQIAPSAPSPKEPSAPLAEGLQFNQPDSTSYLVPDECVVCLERVPTVIFVPCGHLCCCYKCFLSVTLCPLCREEIKSIHGRSDI